MGVPSLGRPPDATSVFAVRARLWFSRRSPIHIRGENKDAYDLYYLLRNYGGGVSDVVGELRPLLLDASAVRALEYLRADFQNSESIGPRRVAEFLFGRPHTDTQADALGFIRQLLTESTALS